MRRSISYEPDYQQVVVLFNADQEILALASIVNRINHCQLVYTGDLNSFDVSVKKELFFHAFTYHDEASKTTFFLIKNKTFFNDENSPKDLFSDQNMLVQRNLIGSKNSIFKHKAFYNSDYCFIFSFPKCQQTPNIFIQKLKQMKEVVALKIISFDDYVVLSELTPEIELYISEYNKMNNQNIHANKRRDLFLNDNSANQSIQNEPKRIIYTDL